jgi:hypothetical protein
MAYYFIFPEADTTLYSHPDRKTMNAGADELLELVKEPGSTDTYNHPSRILIKFKNDDITNAISLVGDTNFTSSLSSSVKLQLSIADTKNLTSTHVINAYAVSQSWDEGTGKYLNIPTGSNGASWFFRDNSGLVTSWTGSGTSTDWFGSAGGTGSISSSLLTQGGGTWYTGSNFYGTQQFLVGESLDTDIDVKEIVHKFSASLNASKTYPEGIDNYGFLLKTLDSVESNVTSSFGEIQYFSSNTHTIYPPKLTFAWDDAFNQSQHYSTSQIKRSGSLFLSLYNNKKEYNQNDVVKFRINVRDKYPTRTFATGSNYLNEGRLKSGKSFYSIRDAHTEREIIPFNDTFTKISNDFYSSFFTIYMKGLQPERYYRILIKLEETNETQIFDDNYFFKVVR